MSVFPILFIFTVVGVRVFPQPFRYFLFFSYDFAYLKITVDGVHVFCPLKVGEMTILVCGMSKPSVEKKDVPNCNIIVVEFSQRRAFLPEGWHPFWSSWFDFFPEVRIQVATTVRVNESVSIQLLDDVVERGSFPLDFRESDAVM